MDPESRAVRRVRVFWMQELYTQICSPDGQDHSILQARDSGVLLISAPRAVEAVGLPQIFTLSIQHLFITAAR